MKLLSLAGTAIGLALIGVLLYWHGVGPVLEALAALGWGMALLPLTYIPNLATAAFSWRLLFAPGVAPRYSRCWLAAWIGRSVNTLLPAAGLGGDVAMARVIALDGVPGSVAGASVVVNKTVETLSLVLWALVGVGLLVWLEAGEKVVFAASIGAGFFALGAIVFIAIQRAGIFGRLARVADRFGGGRFAAMVGGAERIDAEIRAIYDAPLRVAGAITTGLAARTLMSAEVWIAANLMGAPIAIFEAVMLKSLTGALRGGAFFVPNGLGLQEGLYILLGGLVGVGPGTMLAVSLATRAREILVSAPALLFWQRLEGRALSSRAEGADSA